MNLSLYLGHQEKSLVYYMPYYSMFYAHPRWHLKAKKFAIAETPLKICARIGETIYFCQSLKGKLFFYHTAPSHFFGHSQGPFLRRAALLSYYPFCHDVIVVLLQLGQQRHIMNGDSHLWLVPLLYSTPLAPFSVGVQ